MKTIGVSPAFRGVYYAKNKFSKEQVPVLKNILDSFKAPDNMTLERYSYEEKYKRDGYDFLVYPEKDSEGAVSLYALTGMVKRKGGKQKGYSYKEKIKIGEYDSEKSFDIKDAEKLNKKDSGITAGCLAHMLFLAVLGGIAFFSMKNNAPKENISKSTMTVVDSLRTAVADSIECVPQVVK